MNEQDNAQVAREFFSALERGDIEAALGTMTDDVEWWLFGPSEIPYAGVWRGHEEVLRVIGILDSLDYEQFTPYEFVSQNDAVVVLGNERCRVKATNKAFAGEWVSVFKLRNGKIAQFRNYEDTAAIVAAYNGD